MLRRPDTTLSQWQTPSSTCENVHVFVEELFQCLLKPENQIKKAFKNQLKVIKIVKCKKRDFWITFACQEENTSSDRMCCPHANRTATRSWAVLCDSFDAHRSATVTATSAVSPLPPAPALKIGEISLKEVGRFCANPSDSQRYLKFHICPVHTVSAVQPKWNFSAFPPLLQSGEPDLS